MIVPPSSSGLRTGSLTNVQISPSLFGGTSYPGTSTVILRPPASAGDAIERASATKSTRRAMFIISFGVAQGSWKSPGPDVSFDLEYRPYGTGRDRKRRARRHDRRRGEELDGVVVVGRIVVERHQ